MKKGTLFKRIPLLLGGVMVLVSSCGMKDDIADLTNRVDALEGKVATVQEQVSALQSSVEDLKEFDKTLSGRIDELKAADKAIGERIDGLKKELEDKITALDTRLSGELSTLTGTVDEWKQKTQKNADDIASILKTIGQIEGNLAKLDDTFATDSALKEAIESTKESLTKSLTEAFQEALMQYATIAALQEVQSDIDEVSSQLDDIEKEYKKAINDALDAALANDGKITSKINSMINNAVKSLNSRIDALEADIEALLARVQSIVFVPDFSDGKATIKYAMVGTTLVEAQSVLQYQVYPAECAKAIKKEQLSFIFKEVATRANNPELDIVKVEQVEDSEGIINVYVNARNLSADFYKDAASVSYSASLVLDDQKAINIASSYTNLIAVKSGDVEKIGVEIKDATPNAYQIEYTDLKTKQVVLKDHSVKFNINGASEWFILDEMKSKGYDLSIASQVAYTLNDTSKPNVFNNTVTDGKVVVNLKEEKKDAVGLIETITYTYTVGDVVVSTDATVEVVKIQGAIAILANDIVWNFAEDASSDAGISATSSLDKVTIDAKNTKLPTETDYAAVIAGTLKSTEILVDNAAVTGVTATFGGTTAEPTLLLEGFEWGKVYTVKAVYSLSNIDVTISTTVKTVDRSREVIKLVLKTEERPLAYQLDFTTEKESLHAIYEGAKSYLGEMTEADFLLNIVSTTTNLYKVDALTVNGVDASSLSSKLMIAADGATISARYLYSDFAKTEMGIDFVLNMTTWYGQKIEISKRVNLVAPIYDFKHLTSWVVFNSKSDCYSNIIPNYSPNIESAALEFFSVNDIDMEVAFDVVDAAGVPVADLAAAHLKQVFSTTDINCTMTDNKLSYTSKAAEVPVVGKLFFETGVSGEWIELDTKFATDYANYVVKKYDPIGVLTVTNDTINLSEAKTYYSNTWERLGLKDYRNGLPNYDLISNGAWVIGDGSNGFMNGKSVVDIYGLSISFQIDNDTVPAELKDKIAFSNGVLSFNNGAQLQLQKEVKIRVVITVSYPQGVKSAESFITIR
ncbi:MAG: hypothetical protein IKL60_00540 [Alistipes sp.]|nr:hypothetical protein [Alistipes sp.]